MPAQSEKQQKFMQVVHAMQKGKTPKSGKAGQAADSMRPQDVKDFLMQECGLMECNVPAKKRIVTVLKSLIGHNAITEEDEATPEVVASSKTLHGDFDQTLKMYRGFELTPKENQAIQNFDGAEPAVHDKFKVQYSKSDDFTNNSTIVIKKLRQPDGKYVYTALVKVRGGGDEPEPTTEPPAGSAPPQEPAQPSTQAQPPQPQQQMREGGSGDEIKIIKSIPIDDSEGSEILTNFIQSVYHQQA
jgi:hypothetical protein